ncbi:protein-tyrosine phosphatase-like protein [Lipomyces kononenkoae]|uniref:Protein-tyrosine phosphatase-like protein n=1 Tax=Lipomyces kononenkoae TaxID=34357 RepID=A0ACC3TCD8_LIPKO
MNPRISHLNTLTANEAKLSEKFLSLDSEENERTRDGISTGSESEWSLERALDESARNRYRNVLPWDRNRIRLQVGDHGSDYINASPISLQALGLKPRRYIASQGPTKSTIPHFWHMIAHETQDPAVVVMLTPTHEGHREKCAQYWPDRHNDYADAGFACRVTLQSKEFHQGANCAVRKFRLDEYSHDNSKQVKMSKTVYHLLFDSWGDFGTPIVSQERNLVNLCNLANQLNSTEHSPLVVHCSAGVGRTGTFITIDFLLNCITHDSSHALDAGDVGDSSPNTEYIVRSAPLFYRGSFPDPQNTDDPIFETVWNLRKQRMLMVQNVSQFIFIYKIIKLALGSGPE